MSGYLCSVRTGDWLVRGVCGRRSPVEGPGVGGFGGAVGGNFYKNESKIQKASYSSSSSSNHPRRFRSRIWPSCSATTTASFLLPTHFLI